MVGAKELCQWSTPEEAWRCLMSCIPDFDLLYYRFEGF